VLLLLLLLLLLQELCDEVFTKVERLFLLGLRAADPVRRARFFSLYHKHIPAGLFERLQFIICVQVRVAANRLKVGEKIQRQM
jgi:hypothetical protein